MTNALAHAHAAYDSGQFSEALNLYINAGGTALADQKVLRNLATIALYEKRFGDALGLVIRSLPGSIETPDSMHLCGLALLKVGQYDAAADQLESAFSLSPADRGIANTYGHCLMALGRHEEAVKCFYSAAKDHTDVFDYWQDLAWALSSVPLDSIKSNFMEPFKLCLSRSEIKHINISLQARRLIKPVIGTLHELVAVGRYSALEKWCLESRASEETALLITYLENVRCVDVYLEQDLTRLRAFLVSELEALAEGEPLELLFALATQCFLTDYAFYVSEAEAGAIERVNSMLQDALTTGKPLSPNLVALFAAYHPLHTVCDEPLRALENFPTVEANAVWKKLICFQVEEPEEERRLRGAIPSLTPIKDATSVAVQQQYEESPYPRWPGIYWGKGKLPMGFRQSTPTPQKSSSTADHQVLIAGCGTGQHAFTYSIEQPLASITAVDLSRSSLAHAERMKRKLGFDNLSFFHGDILCLPEQELVFDEISCGGVLHHLRDPGAGLRALGKVFSGKGTFHLEVYTESGRQSVVAGLALREEYGLEPTAEDIRRFRKLVLALPDHHPAKGLTKFADFFSLFECRDLVFNVQEHRFNLVTLADLLLENGFKFSGIRVAPDLLNLFRRENPDPRATKKPECWHALEQSHPGVFGSMYNILVSPVSN